MTFALRPATPADAPAFHAVMMAAGMDPRSSWTRTTVGDIARSLSLGGGFLAWADLSGVGERAVGCVGFRPDGAGTLTLNKLARMPEMRGQGIGAALVRAVEQVAAERGYQRVLLAVSQYNLEVLPFYKRLGYVRSDEVYTFSSPGSPRPEVLVKAVNNVEKRIEELRIHILAFFETHSLSPLEKFSIIGLKLGLNQSISQKKLIEIEKKLDVCFPEEYSLFLTRISNGLICKHANIMSIDESIALIDWSLKSEFVYSEAWNPDYDALDLDDSVDKIGEKEYSRRLESQNHYFDEKHLSGSIIVSDIGCGYYEHLIITGKERGKIWEDVRAADAGINPRLISGEPATFLNYYEAMIRKSLKEIEDELK